MTLILGWFWSGSGSRISPTNSTPKGWPRSPWSHTGYIGQFLSKYLIIESFKFLQGLFIKRFGFLYNPHHFRVKILFQPL